MFIYSLRGEIDMTVMEEGWKTNEKGSITSDVHIGDVVRLLVDGEFFRGKQFSEEGAHSEKYGGFVASITDRVISLSTTHHKNACHGYTTSKLKQERAIAEIEIERVKQYRIV